MYVSFFNLREQPFNLTPDPRFLFLSPQHEEALSHLLYGIHERKGFIAITGEVGTGKTVLSRALLERLEAGVSTALIFNSYITEIELLQAILSDFGLTCQENTRKSYIDTLNQYLLQEFAAGRNAMVLVDEAQNLEPMVLEQLRMLSNLETDDGKLLQVVLVGQPELHDKLLTPQMRQLNQRIAVRFHLNGLNRTAMRQYVMHRLSVAGAANGVTFTSRAWTMIHQHCEGIPRRINLLCDRVLMTAYVRGTHRISASIVRQSQRDLTGLRRPSPVQRPPFYYPALALAGSSLIGLGAFGFVTGAFIFPLLQERLRPFMPDYVMPDHVQPLTQALTAPPSLPQPATPPPPAPVSTTPTPQPSLSLKVNLPLAQTLWQVKTQAESLLSPPQASQPADRDAIVARAATARGLDTMTIQADLAQLARLSRPCLIEVVPEPTSSQQVLWVLARGTDDGVLIYDPEGLTSVPLQQLQQLWSGTIYLLLEREKYRGPTLRQGMQGARVQTLQQFLQNLGYLTGPLSGQFDSQTLQAVKAFQRENQLVVDGYVGRQTLMMLLYLDSHRLTETM